MTATGPRDARRAEVRQRAGVVAADEERDDAGLDDRARPPTRSPRSSARCSRARSRRRRSRRTTGCSNGLTSRFGLYGRSMTLAARTRVRAEPPAGAVGDAGVERDADDGEVDVLERPDVRQSRERRRPREPRALAASPPGRSAAPCGRSYSGARSRRRQPHAAYGDELVRSIEPIGRLEGRRRTNGCRGPIAPVFAPAPPWLSGRAGYVSGCRA